MLVRVACCRVKRALAICVPTVFLDLELRSARSSKSNKAVPPDLIELIGSAGKGLIELLRVRGNHLPMPQAIKQKGLWKIVEACERLRKSVSRDLIELIESTGKALIELMTVPDPELARPANSEFLSGFH